MSLRLRLALFGAAVVGVALLVFGVLLYALVAASVAGNQDTDLRARAAQAVTALDASPIVSPQPAVAPADLRASNEVFVEVFDRGWNLLYSTAVVGGAPPQPTERMKAAATASTAGYYDTDAGIRYFGLGYDRGVVVTGQSLRVPQSNLSGIKGFLVISAIPALIAALVASWLVAGRALQPLKVFAAEAAAIGSTGDFGRRVPVPPSHDEVAGLAGNFNGMLSRLQHAYESQRRFVADASHELRTPLTTIQGNAGLLASRDLDREARRAAAADIAAESARMARLVDRLLTLARADSGVALPLAPVELKPVVEAACRQAGAVHPDRQLVVSADDATVAGDEDALRQLLLILLDNAFRYARSTVTVELEQAQGWARIVVADDGTGIPPEQRERIFERFYRVEQSRAGGQNGLGLAIARWIVAEHRGRIVAGSAMLGGAAFLVDLPLLSAP